MILCYLHREDCIIFSLQHKNQQFHFITNNGKKLNYPFNNQSSISLLPFSIPTPPYQYKSTVLAIFNNKLQQK